MLLVWFWSLQSVVRILCCFITSWQPYILSSYIWWLVYSSRGNFFYFFLSVCKSEVYTWILWYIYFFFLSKSFRIFFLFFLPINTSIQLQARYEKHMLQMRYSKILCKSKYKSMCSYLRRRSSNMQTQNHTHSTSQGFDKIYKIVVNIKKKNVDFVWYIDTDMIIIDSHCFFIRKQCKGICLYFRRFLLFLFDISKPNRQLSFKSFFEVFSIKECHGRVYSFKFNDDDRKLYEFVNFSL